MGAHAHISSHPIPHSFHSSYIPPATFPVNPLNHLSFTPPLAHCIISFHSSSIVPFFSPPSLLAPLLIPSPYVLWLFTPGSHSYHLPLCVHVLHISHVLYKLLIPHDSVHAPCALETFTHFNTPCAPHTSLTPPTPFSIHLTASVLYFSCHVSCTVNGTLCTNLHG